MFWPFPLIRAYPTSKDLTALFVSFATSDDFEITHTSAVKVEVRCEHGRLNFWNSNFPYAWASRGIFTPDNAERTTWDKEMPSRWAAVLMRQRIELATEKFKLPRGALR